MTPPTYVTDVPAFLDWLRTQGRQLENFAQELASNREDLDYFEQVNADLEKLFDETDIDAPRVWDDEARDRLKLVFDRYKAVRGALHEWHDLDISADDYAEKIEAFAKKASDDDDLRYRVRAGLAKMGLITDADSNIPAARMLTALLGVEFGT